MSTSQKLAGNTWSNFETSKLQYEHEKQKEKIANKPNYFPRLSLFLKRDDVFVAFGVKTSVNTQRAGHPFATASAAGGKA